MRFLVFVNNYDCLYVFYQWCDAKDASILRSLNKGHWNGLRGQFSNLSPEQTELCYKLYNRCRPPFLESTDGSETPIITVSMNRPS